MEHNNEVNTEFNIMVCECSSTEHQIVFVKDEEDGYIYCHIHLTPKTFFDRLKNGIKYIFGHRSIYGDFDEIILTKKHTEQVKDMYEFLKRN